MRWDASSVLNSPHFSTRFETSYDDYQSGVFFFLLVTFSYMNWRKVEVHTYLFFNVKINVIRHDQRLNFVCQFHFLYWEPLYHYTPFFNCVRKHKKQQETLFLKAFFTNDKDFILTELCKTISITFTAYPNIRWS